MSKEKGGIGKDSELKPKKARPSAAFPKYTQGTHGGSNASAALGNFKPGTSGGKSSVKNAGRNAKEK